MYHDFKERAYPIYTLLPKPFEKKKKQKRLDLGELFCQYPLALLLLTSLLSVQFMSFCTLLYV